MIVTRKTSVTAPRIVGTSSRMRWRSRVNTLQTLDGNSPLEAKTLNVAQLRKFQWFCESFRILSRTLQRCPNNLRTKKSTNQNNPKGIPSENTLYENCAPLLLSYPFGIGRLETYPRAVSLIETHLEQPDNTGWMNLVTLHTRGIGGHDG